MKSVQAATLYNDRRKELVERIKETIKTGFLNVSKKFRNFLIRLIHRWAITNKSIIVNRIYEKFKGDVKAIHDKKIDSGEKVSAFDSLEYE